MSMLVQTVIVENASVCTLQNLQTLGFSQHTLATKKLTIPRTGTRLGNLKEKIRLVSYTKRKQTKSVLAKFITLHKARAVYHWEVVADTKLFKDSSLGNYVCTSRCRTK